MAEEYLENSIVPSEAEVLVAENGTEEEPVGKTWSVTVPILKDEAVTTTQKEPTPAVVGPATTGVNAEVDPATAPIPSYAIPTSRTSPDYIASAGWDVDDFKEAFADEGIFVKYLLKASVEQWRAAWEKHFQDDRDYNWLYTTSHLAKVNKLKNLGATSLKRPQLVAACKKYDLDQHQKKIDEAAIAARLASAEQALVGSQITRVSKAWKLCLTLRGTPARIESIDEIVIPIVPQQQDLSEIVITASTSHNSSNCARIRFIIPSLDTAETIDIRVWGSVAQADVSFAMRLIDLPHQPFVRNNYRDHHLFIESSNAERANYWERVATDLQERLDSLPSPNTVHKTPADLSSTTPVEHVSNDASLNEPDQATVFVPTASGGEHGGGSGGDVETHVIGGALSPISPGTVVHPLVKIIPHPSAYVQDDISVSGVPDDQSCTTPNPIQQESSQGRITKVTTEEITIESDSTQLDTVQEVTSEEDMAQPQASSLPDDPSSSTEKRPIDQVDVDYNEANNQTEPNKRVRADAGSTQTATAHQVTGHVESVPQHCQTIPCDQSQPQISTWKRGWSSGDQQDTPPSKKTKTDSDATTPPLRSTSGFDLLRTQQATAYGHGALDRPISDTPKPRPEVDEQVVYGSFSSSPIPGPSISGAQPHVIPETQDQPQPSPAIPSSPPAPGRATEPESLNQSQKIAEPASTQDQDDSDSLFGEGPEIDDAILQDVIPSTS